MAFRLQLNQFTSITVLHRSSALYSSLLLWQLNHFDPIDIFHCHCHSRPLPAVLVQIYLKLYQAGQAQG